MFSTDFMNAVRTELVGFINSVMEESDEFIVKAAKLAINEEHLTDMATEKAEKLSELIRLDMAHDN